ncbi:hypothetical protein IJJ12_01720 [bacterium]|nr:hypothetical protein [bacterium]
MKTERSTLPVITTGDEGVQLNAGRRFALAGAGVGLAHAEEAMDIIERESGQTVTLVSGEQDDFLAAQLANPNQHEYEAVTRTWAQERGRAYAGQLLFGDPRELSAGVRGHLVRPAGVHVAEQIVLTIGGGESQFSLRSVVISADFASALAKDKLAEIIGTQINFYRQLLGQELSVVIDDQGGWPAAIVAANRAAVQSIL